MLLIPRSCRREWRVLQLFSLYAAFLGLAFLPSMESSLRPRSSVCNSPNASVQGCFWLGQLVTDAVFKQGWLLPRIRPRALESCWLFITIRTQIVGMQTSLWPSATGTWPFVGTLPNSPAWGTCQSSAFFLAASVNSSDAFCNVSTYSPRSGQSGALCSQRLSHHGNCWPLWPLWFLLRWWPRGDTSFISQQFPQALIFPVLLSLQFHGRLHCWKEGLTIRWDGLGSIGPFKRTCPDGSWDCTDLIIAI